MQYTDKQIEEAVEKAVLQNQTGTLFPFAKLLMRMIREEYRANTEPPVRLKLPEFWKEPEEAPNETRFGGVDLSNGPLTGEDAKRLRTLHEARWLIDDLIKESASKQEQDKHQGWQPIITVPLISGPEQCIFIAHTSLCRYGISAFYEQGRWRDANSGAPIVWQPTHWMPIPPLPEDK